MRRSNHLLRIAILIAGITCVSTNKLQAQGGPGLAAPLPGQRGTIGSRTPVQSLEGRTGAGTVSETAVGAALPEHPLTDCLRLAKESQKTLDDVKDYTATLSKIEVVGGQVLDQHIAIKVREKPFSVYMRYITPAAGREVLYVQGVNNNQLLAHEGTGPKSLLGTMSFAPDAPRMMAESRHPVTEIGMRNLLKQTIKQWEFETQFGEVKIQYYPDAKIGQASTNKPGEPEGKVLNCIVLESSHPVPRKQFPYHLGRLFLDKTTKYPVRIELYGFPQRPDAPPPLLEQYTYQDLKVNVGLSDADFDRGNRNYKF